MGEGGKTSDVPTEGLSEGRGLRIAQRGEFSSGVNHRTVVLAQLNRVLTPAFDACGVARFSERLSNGRDRIGGAGGQVRHQLIGTLLRERLDSGITLGTGDEPQGLQRKVVV